MFCVIGCIVWLICRVSLWVGVRISVCGVWLNFWCLLLLLCCIVSRCLMSGVLKVMVLFDLVWLWLSML